MQLLGHRKAGQQVWHLLLIVVVVCSLTLSVATRFWAPYLFQSHSVPSVTSRVSQPKCQHLEKDTAYWVTPVVGFNFVETAHVESCLLPTRVPLPRAVFGESLSNRPPPLSRTLA